MKTIILHGELAEKFGERWVLDVSTPAEAFRAIEVNRPGFAQHLVESDQRGVGYRIVLDEQDIAAAALSDPFGREVLHLVPVIGGSAGEGKIVVGALLIAFAVITGGAGLSLAAAYAEGGLALAGALAFNVGVSLTIAGISQMIAGTPKAPDPGTPQALKQSYYFSGPENTTGQGGPVPVGYGRLLIGSHTISAGISAEAIYIPGPSPVLDLTLGWHLNYIGPSQWDPPEYGD